MNFHRNFWKKLQQGFVCKSGEKSQKHSQQDFYDESYQAFVGEFKEGFSKNFFWIA